MLNHIKLTNVGPAESLRFDFAPRLNIITGDNGLGKSFILDVAWWALTGNWAGEPAAPRAKGTAIEFGDAMLSPYRDDTLRAEYNFSLPARQAWTYPGWQFSPSRLVMYVQIDNSVSVLDKSKIKHQTLADDTTSGILHFSSDDIWGGLADGGRVLCNGMIVDWANWTTRAPEVFAQFTAALKTLSARDSEPMRPGPLMRTAIDDVRDIPTLEMPYGRVPITQVSAGMKRILGIAYLLVWSWNEHRRVAEMMGRQPTSSIVLLIDEIEAHLHPQWQRRILPAIHQAAKALAPEVDVQILAVTHSPLVLASMESEFDAEKDALFKFDLDDDSKVTADKMDWRPRGDASSWLTSEIFGLGQARSIEAERAIENAMAAMRDSTLPIDKVREIHHELHSVLKDFDPFWPRWLVRAAAAGVDP